MPNPLKLQKRKFLGILEDRFSKLPTYKEINNLLWRKIADEINVDGPIVKEGYKWRRVFKCLRWKVDKKRQQNISLTSDDRRVSALDRKIKEMRSLKEGHYISDPNPTTSSVNSYQKMCRLCLSINESTKLINLFVCSITDEGSLCPIKKLKQLSPFTSLEKEDGLPQSICESCLNSLDKAYTFKMLCESSDSLLRNGWTGMTIEPTDNNYITTDYLQPKVEPDEIQFENIQLPCMKNELELELDAEPPMEKEGLICQYCDRTFKSHRYYDQHVEGHLNNQEYMCSKCPFKTDIKGRIRAHVKIHVDPHKLIRQVDRNMQCKECDKKFSSRSNMLKHARFVHMNERNFQCEECGFRLTTRKHFLDHYVAVHEKIKQYKCSECENAYFWCGGLKKHLKKCHPHIVFTTGNDFRKLTAEESEKLMKANIKIKNLTFSI